MASPSVKARTETSGPVKNSSMTTQLPLSPKTLSSIMARTPARASSRVWAMMTPLPRARPSAFTTVGRGAVSKYASAASSSVKLSYAAVGMPYLRIRSFEKTLLPSRIAARLLGPKQAMPRASSASTAPSTRGSSGATTAKSTSLSTANATMPAMSVAAMSTQVASRAIPPLPGSAYSVVTSGFLARALTRACSRPPPPTTMTFIGALLVVEQADAVEGHRHAVFVAGVNHVVVAH